MQLTTAIACSAIH